MSQDGLGMEFEPRMLQSLMKQGGKKKLDTLMALFKAEAPKRVAEIEAAQDDAEAKAAARVLKASAANLGLMALEELCEQVVAGSAAKPMVPRFKSALSKALAWLDQSRKAM